MGLLQSSIRTVFDMFFGYNSESGSFSNRLQTKHMDSSEDLVFQKNQTTSGTELFFETPSKKLFFVVFQ